jgi:hypothetical protein
MERERKADWFCPQNAWNDAEREQKEDGRTTEHTKSTEQEDVKKGNCQGNIGQGNGERGLTANHAKHTKWGTSRK